MMHQLSLDAVRGQCGLETKDLDVVSSPKVTNKLVKIERDKFEKLIDQRTSGAGIFPRSGLTRAVGPVGLSIESLREPSGENAISKQDVLWTPDMERGAVELLDRWSRSTGTSRRPFTPGKTPVDRCRAGRLFLGEFDAEREILAFDEAERLVEACHCGRRGRDRHDGGQTGGEDESGSDRRSPAMCGQLARDLAVESLRDSQATRWGVHIGHHPLHPCVE